MLLSVNGRIRHSSSARCDELMVVSCATVALLKNVFGALSGFCPLEESGHLPFFAYSFRIRGVSPFFCIPFLKTSIRWPPLVEIVVVLTGFVLTWRYPIRV